jgi:hypothetical protein
MLMFLHAIADFALQSDVMAKGKNRNNEKIQRLHWIQELERDPKDFKKTWFYWLSAHALIQGGLILLIFGNVWIAMIEIVTHFIIDFTKCENKLTPHQDQAFHFTLRIVYTIVLIL